MEQPHKPDVGREARHGSRHTVLVRTQSRWSGAQKLDTRTGFILSEGHDGCAGHEGDFWDPE